MREKIVNLSKDIKYKLELYADHYHMDIEEAVNAALDSAIALVYVVDDKYAPHVKAHTEAIDCTLRDMQEIVGGYIEVLELYEYDLDPEIVLVVDEEGLLKQNPTSHLTVAPYGNIVGTCFFIRRDGLGNFCSLIDGDITAIDKAFNL